MALQSSGQIDISDIQAELGSSSGSLRTLSAAAGFSAPDAMSEFYGYSAFSNTTSFAPVTYTGNGSTQSITTGFQPDLVWIKARSYAYVNELTDAVRGNTKNLFSDQALAEYTETNTVQSFNSNGFTIGSEARINQSGQTYVAWCWKGGNGTVTNTNGTVTSTVSANQAAGFSIATYTGPGYTGSNVTVGHGLSQAPELYIVKNRSYGVGWLGWNTVTPSSGTDYFFLNSGGAFGTAAQPVPTSTVNYLQSAGNFESVYSGHSYVMYSWHSVSGYSKVGKYTGNAGTNAITTGFAPRFVMIKAVTTTGSWFLHDIQRLGTHGYSDKYLQANSNATEIDSSDNDLLEFTSTGFTLRTNFGDYNGSGQTYIYLAIA